MDNVITESDETNNNLSKALPEVAASDLIVTAISCVPQSGISDGDEVILTATVQNIGTGNTSRSFYVRFEVDGTYIGHQMVSDGLAVGESRPVSQTWIASPGNHTATAMADEGNTVKLWTTALPYNRQMRTATVVLRHPIPTAKEDIAVLVSKKDKADNDIKPLQIRLISPSHQAVTCISANHFVIEEWVILGDPSLKIGGYK